jgi:hypothetical protein
MGEGGGFSCCESMNSPERKKKKKAKPPLLPFLFYFTWLLEKVYDSITSSFFIFYFSKVLVWCII